MSKQASWDSVKAKGEAILANGGVQIVEDTPEQVVAYVMSGVVEGQFPVTDGGPYEVILSKRSWENSGNVGGWVQGFLCECTWGYYHSGQPGRGWSGRFCSHAYAALKACNMRARRDFMRDKAASAVSKTAEILMPDIYYEDGAIVLDDEGVMLDDLYIDQFDEETAVDWGIGTLKAYGLDFDEDEVERIVRDIYDKYGAEKEGAKKASSEDGVEYTSEFPWNQCVVKTYLVDEPRGESHGTYGYDIFLRNGEWISGTNSSFPTESDAIEDAVDRIDRTGFDNVSRGIVVAGAPQHSNNIMDWIDDLELSDFETTPTRGEDSYELHRDGVDLYITCINYGLWMPQLGWYSDPNIGLVKSPDDFDNPYDALEELVDMVYVEYSKYGLPHSASKSAWRDWVVSPDETHASNKWTDSDWVDYYGYAEDSGYWSISMGGSGMVLVEGDAKGLWSAIAECDAHARRSGYTASHNSAASLMRGAAHVGYDWRYDADGYYKLVMDDSIDLREGAWVDIDGDWLTYVDTTIIVLSYDFDENSWSVGAYDEGHYDSRIFDSYPPNYFASAEDAVDWLNGHINWIGDFRIPKLSFSVAAGRRLDYDDDVVVVRNPDGGIDYKGIFDYCPYKYDFDEGGWKFNGELYEDTEHPGYTLEVIAGLGRDAHLGLEGGGHPSKSAGWTPYETESGIKYDVLEEFDPTWSGYDRAVADGLMHDFGYIFVDEYGSPIDSEYDIADIVEHFERQSSVAHNPHSASGAHFFKQAWTFTVGGDSSVYYSIDELCRCKRIPSGPVYGAFRKKENAEKFDKYHEVTVNVFDYEITKRDDGDGDGDHAPEGAPEDTPEPDTVAHGEQLKLFGRDSRFASDWQLYEENITPELRYDVLDPDEILDMYGAYVDESYRKVENGMLGVVTHHVGMVDDWWSWDTYAGYYSYGIDCGTCDGKEEGMAMCEMSFANPGFTVYSSSKSSARGKTAGDYYRAGIDGTDYYLEATWNDIKLCSEIDGSDQYFAYEIIQDAYAYNQYELTGKIMRIIGPKNDDDDWFYELQENVWNAVGECLEWEQGAYLGWEDDVYASKDAKKVVSGDGYVGEQFFFEGVMNEIIDVKYEEYDDEVEPTYKIIDENGDIWFATNTDLETMRYHGASMSVEGSVGYDMDGRELRISDAVYKSDEDVWYRIRDVDRFGVIELEDITKAIHRIRAYYSDGWEAPLSVQWNGWEDTLQLLNGSYVIYELDMADISDLEMDIDDIVDAMRSAAEDEDITINEDFSELVYKVEDVLSSSRRYAGKSASVKNATRKFTYAEMKELEDEIEGRELHNYDRFKDGGVSYRGGF